MDNAQIVRSIYETVMRGDIPAALESFHDEFEVEEADSLPYAGTYRGRAGFLTLLGKISETWKDFGATILDVSGSGDRVYALLEVSGSVGSRPEPLTMRIVEVWKLQGGKAVELRPFYWDSAKLAEMSSR